MTDEVDQLIDARGRRCPIPTLLLRRAIERAHPGERLRLIADDPIARIDVPHFAAEIGLEIVSVSAGEKDIEFILRLP